MKTIKTAAIIEGIRSRKDRSLGLTVSTPELSVNEKALFMEMQGINVEVLIRPVDEPTADIHEVDTDLNQKSQSQRMRSVLYILWKQNSEDLDFPEYYRRKTETLIDWLKGKIEE